MRKVVFFAATAGVGIFFAGCTPEVMTDRHYIPAPSDNVPLTDNVVEPATLPAERGMEKPSRPAPARKTVYEPMTDVVASEGVDSAEGGIRPTRRGGDRKTAPVAGGTYLIKRGDTPERIARRHGVRLRDFMEINHLDDKSARKLRIGQKVIIPGAAAKSGEVAVSGKSGKPAKADKSAKSGKSGKSAAPALEGGKYSVKPGDTPERIARRFKIKVGDLLKANGLDENSARRLRIDQKLVIPGKAVAPVESAPAAPAPAAPTPAAPAKDSVVETPAAVPEAVPAAPAAEFDNPDNFEAVTLTEDTTIGEFAAKFGYSEAELRKLNGNPPSDKLTKGGLFYVPKKAAPRN